jgi:hypothetical protein
MAIQGKITTIQGVSLDTAYINIQMPQIIKVKQGDNTNKYNISGNVCIYVDSVIYTAGNIPIECFSITCELDLTKNPLEQLYTVLKSNTRLSNITDLL